MLAGCGTAHHPAAKPTVQYNRDAARTAAHNMLHLIVLPAGAARSSSMPPASLAGPAQGPPATPAVVDLRAWWRVKGTMSQVTRFIQSHPPRDAVKVGVGTMGGRRGVLNRSVTFSWPPVNGVLGQRSLEIEVVPLTRGYAGVRADARVVWIQPKATGERVPASARVLFVTRGFPRHRPSLTFSTTNPAKVQAVAATLNRLAPVQPGAVSCPNIPLGPTVTFTFRARPGGPVLAQATTLASGPRGECPGVDLTVGGQAQRPLSAQPALLRKAGQLLGITLLTK